MTSLVIYNDTPYNHMFLLYGATDRSKTVLLL